MGDISGREQRPRSNIISIYYPESDEWEFISSASGDTGLLVEELFVDSTGGVWGRVTWQHGQEYPNMENFPVLSRFNETTRRFEIAEGILEIPLVPARIENGITTLLYDQTRILLDEQEDIFWIFATNDGLYSYDPATQVTERRDDFPDDAPGQIMLAPDGSIYFTNYAMLPGIIPALFQFSPETGEAVSIDLPDETMPVFWGMLIDSTNRIWLGAIAYREPDGVWHIMHPHPEAYFDLVENGGYSYVWESPAPMLESSDGRLWYIRFSDTSGWVDGTAWYDPETGEGCMFTNYPVNIIEDSQQQLWLAADGMLFKYPLNAR